MKIKKDKNTKRTYYIKIALIVFTIIAAVIARFSLATSYLETISNDIFLPIIDAAMGLIKACASILVFTSIVSAILSNENINSFKSIGGRIIFRFFIISLGVCCIAFFICFVLMDIPFGSGADFDISTLEKTFISIIPSSFIEPFVEGDSIQILFWAILVGICAILIKNRIKILIEVFDAINDLSFKIMSVVAKLIPVIILFSIANIIILNDFSNFIPVSKIIFINYGIVLFISLAAITYVCLKWKIGPIHFIRKVFSVLSFAFVSASGTATMPKTFEMCDEMGIDDKLTQLWVPLSHSLFSPSFSVSTITCVLYCAKTTGTCLSIVQIFMLIIMITLFSMAAPKGGGGTFAITVLIANQLNIPVYDVAIIFIIDSFIKRVDCSFGMFIRGLDIFDLSSSSKQIDMKKYQENKEYV